MFGSHCIGMEPGARRSARRTGEAAAIAHVARVVHVALVVLATLVVLAPSLSRVCAADPLDVNWSDDFGAPGLIGIPTAWPYTAVAAAVNWNGTLVVAGNLTHAGGTPVQNVVSWNGTEFVQMGAGLNGSVASLAVVGGTLYAAGEFTASGATPLPNVARWTGSAWAPVGAGAPDATARLVLVADGASLLLLGEFTTIDSPPVAAQSIARWDGTSWSDVGGFDNGGYTALRGAARVGSTLYVGGTVRESSSLHSWDGSSWTYDIGGIDGEINSLAALGTDLYLAGDFYSVDSGNLAVEGIARWDGGAFSTLDDISPDGSIDHIGIDNGELFVVGSFYNFPGPYCAYWDGANWSGGPPRLWGKFGVGLTAFARVGGDLFLGGRVDGFYDFALGGVVRGAAGIAAWDGSAFRALGPGFGVADGEYVYGVSSYGGELVATGNFTAIGRLGGAAGIATWDGTEWSALGGGLDDGLGNPSGDRLGAWAGRLVVTGYFTGAGAGAVTSRNIAAWNGTSWEGFNGGITGQGVQIVEHAGELVIAGLLGTEEGSGNVLGHVARWMGTQWQTVGTMSPSAGASATHAIAWDGKVVCAGQFSSMNGVAAENIAQWNGTTWSALGSGLNGRVSALAVHNGDLYASGLFTASGATPLPGRLARWNGAAWTPIATTPGVALDEMLSVNGALYVIGNFETVDGVPAVRIASWDGTAWSALGSGLAEGIGGNDLGALSLTAYDGALFVGGFFNTAGDKSSQKIARWALSSPTPVEHAGGDVDGFGGELDADILGAAAPRLSFLSANPATERVRLLLQLPAETNLEAGVFDVSGRRIATLASGRFAARGHALEWDGRDEAGRRAGAGVYWVRVQTEQAAASKKVVWVR